jgi:6-phosphofructokinase 1
MKKIFLCYNFKDSITIRKYFQLFKKYSNPDWEIFFYEKYYHTGNWKDCVNQYISQCGYFIFFNGESIGETQQDEIDAILKSKEKNSNQELIQVFIASNPEKAKPDPLNSDKFVEFKQKGDFPGILSEFLSFKDLFKKIANRDINYNDGLPKEEQIFNYEKDIIDFYYKLMSPDLHDEPEVERPFYKEIESKIANGIPVTWPDLKPDNRQNFIDNPLTDVGAYRDDSNTVLSAAISNYHCIENNFCMQSKGLVFKEAGPRKKVMLPIFNTPKDTFRIAILVSGGIAPGINAVIDGITSRHYKYAEASDYFHKIEVVGLINGFNSLLKPGGIQYLPLYSGDKPKLLNDNPKAIDTSSLVNLGGSKIGTSRNEKLIVEKDRMNALISIIRRLYDEDIRILYVIGGEGSMKAAHALSKVANQYRIQEGKTWKLSVIGIPKTMDNDILWVWQTFGFMSAVDKAREFIDYIAVETTSNPRLGIVQLFGSNSGFVVSHAVLASRSGICDMALIPEVEFKLEKVVKFLEQKLETKDDHGLIVMSETAIPKDADIFLDKYKNDINLDEEEKVQLETHINKNKFKIEGHINDKLRSAGLKIVKTVIEKRLGIRVLTNEPRHLLRAMPPSTVDIISASRLGTLAVDNAIAGYSDFMISQWLTEFCLVPLDLVVLGRKRIHKDGIFWKSVIAKTGQPKELI